MRPSRGGVHTSRPLSASGPRAGISDDEHSSIYHRVQGSVLDFFRRASTPNSADLGASEGYDTPGPHALHPSSIPGRVHVPMNAPTPLSTPEAHSSLEQIPPPQLTVGPLTRTDALAQDISDAMQSHIPLPMTRSLGVAPFPHAINETSLWLDTRMLSDSELQDVIGQGRVRLACPAEPLARQAILCQLAGVLLDRASRSAVERSALDEAVGFLEEAAALERNCTSRRWEILVKLAQSLTWRYTRTRNFDDLYRFIALYEEARGIRETVEVLHALAEGLVERFRLSGDPRDMDESIRREEETHNLPCHPAPSHSFAWLSQSLWHRYTRFGDINDLDRCISFQKKALTCVPHDARYPLLLGLAQILHQRSTLTRDITYCDQAISHVREARGLCPMGHAGHVHCLMALSYMLGFHYMLTNDLNDMNEAIDIHRELLKIPHAPNQHKTLRMMLCNMLHQRSDRTGSLTDLQESIAMQHQALSLSNEDHPKHFISGMHPPTAARMLYSRFMQDGQRGDLDQCITIWREVISTCPPNHPERHAYLSLLSQALCDRCEVSGDPRDLAQWVALCEENLATCPDDRRVMAQIRWAMALRARFRMHEDLSDLEQATKTLRGLLPLCTTSGPERRQLLVQLSSFLVDQFQISGNAQDIDDSLALIREAMGLCPPSRTDGVYSSIVKHLAHSLYTRFTATGDGSNLDECITCLRACLVNELPGSLPRSVTLELLGAALYKHFEQSGNLEDLQQSITYSRQALILSSRVRTRSRLPLLHLAQALCTRSRWYTKSAMTIHEIDERKLHDDTHEAFCDTASSTYSLGVRDLDEAIKVYRDVISVGHSVVAYMGLAAALQARFLQSLERDALQEAINCYREVLDACESNTSQRARVFSELSACLRIRATLDSSDDDLRESLAHARNAIAVTRSKETFAPVHTVWALAAVLISSYRAHGPASISYLNEALNLLEDFVTSPPCTIPAVFLSRLAAYWAQVAHEEAHTSTAKAYEEAIALTVCALSIPATLEVQHDILRHTILPLALHAASYALESGNADLAIQALESGRYLLLSEFRGFRAPLGRLRDRDSKLYDKFVAATRALEMLGTSFSGESAFPTEAFSARPLFPRDRAGVTMARRKELKADLDVTVETIRQLPGFADFLKPPKLDVLLRSVAKEGPVLIINHTKYRCDVVIVLQGRSPVIVPLDDDFYARTIAMTSDLTCARQNLRSAQKHYGAVLRHILEDLGELFAEPVVHALKILGVQKKSRIWLCPTSVLTALPLHAAGPIGNWDDYSSARDTHSIRPKRDKAKRVYLQDLFVCSYIPSLSALMEARESQKSANLHPSSCPSILVVAQPGGSLHAVHEELSALRDLQFSSTDYLIGENAHLQEVLQQLTSHPWVHFACHGVLESGAPFKSAFVLAGSDRLTLLDIIKSHIPYSEFAFLSACHTASQTKDSAADEVLHLAAAMQFLGYRSVVGTMWQMQDKDGPDLARDFYREMFSNSNAGTYPLETGGRKAARALNIATREMRKRKQVTLEQWVNFIHTGA